MSLIALLDANTLWGRHFYNLHGKYPKALIDSKQVGFVGLVILKTAPCILTKAALLSSYSSCSKGCCQHIPISLQTDEAVAHHRLGLEPARPEWSDTLERIGQCCAVFSVDTAVAHLSAGSGRPTTMLLGDPPDWRWRPVPEDPHAPLWYPTSVDLHTLKTAQHP